MDCPIFVRMDCPIFVRMDNYFRVSGDKQIIVKNVERIYNVYILSPKRTLQSSLLYYFIKCDYTTFLHFVQVVRDVLRTNAKFEPSSVKPNFCRSI